MGAVRIKRNPDVLNKAIRTGGRVLTDWNGRATNCRMIQGLNSALLPSSSARETTKVELCSAGGKNGLLSF